LVNLTRSRRNLDDSHQAGVNSHRSSAFASESAPTSSSSGTWCSKNSVKPCTLLSLSKSTAVLNLPPRSLSVGYLDCATTRVLSVNAGWFAVSRAEWNQVSHPSTWCFEQNAFASSDELHSTSMNMTLPTNLVALCSNADFIARHLPKSHETSRAISYAILRHDGNGDERRWGRGMVIGGHLLHHDSKNFTKTGYSSLMSSSE